MKTEKFTIMKKTGLLQATYEFIHMLFSLFAARILSNITDRIQTAAVRTAAMQCLCLILVWFFYGICLAFFQRLLLSIRTREQLQARERIFRNILYAHRRQRERVSAGRILENLSNDCDRVTDHYGRKLPIAAVTGLSVAVYLAVSIFLSPTAAVFMLLLAFLQLLPHVLVKRIFIKNYMDCREIEAEITDVFIAGYKGAEEIKVYNALPWLNGILYKKHREYGKTGMKSEIAYTGETMVSSLIGQLIKYGYFAVLGLLFSIKMIQASTVAAMVVISGAFFHGMNTLFQIIPQFSVDRVAYRRLAEWDVLSHEEEKAGLCTEVDRKGKWLHVEGLEQSYGGKIIFQKLTVDIPLDKRVAVCGENGSGKTTFLKMIAGQARGEQGMVQSDKGYWESLAAGTKIAYLPQECPGLSFCARELIGDGQEVFRELIRQFEMEEVLLDKPLESLSGGQRKKIYLAAAFSLQAPLLLLDEPDNELDEAGKAVLKEQMLIYPGGILFVSHEKEFQELAQVIIDLNEIEGAVL